jgi:aryl-alcohol dehydrogenase-like predicted oxidoreductase
MFIFMRATPSQIALAWLLHRSPNLIVIPGTTSISHLEQNMAAADINLSSSDLAELQDINPDVSPL